MPKTASKKTNTASYAHSNWQRHKIGSPAINIIESRLYTDAGITEDACFGPITLLNTMISHQKAFSGSLSPAIVLRLGLHDASGRSADILANDFKHYHGGDFVDEIAALVSLSLGIRCEAGPIDRDFQSGKDPLGRPIYFGGKAIPVLLPSRSPAQIPRLTRSCSMRAVSLLNSFPDMSIKHTNAFVKSARLYQQAVWISDSNPAFSWLLLTSAVETVAGVWKEDSIDSVRQLEEYHPQVYEMLTGFEEQEPLKAVAQILGEITRSTKRFVEFMLNFNPPPPPERPQQYARLDFNEGQMRKALTLIYKHRSTNLHAGTAFPFPMCEPPEQHGTKDEPAVNEKPIGMSTETRNAVWNQQQTPMLLHMFEWLARGAILNWWASLSSLE